MVALLSQIAQSETHQRPGAKAPELAKKYVCLFCCKDSSNSYFLTVK